MNGKSQLDSRVEHEGSVGVNKKEKQVRAIPHPKTKERKMDDL